MATRPLPEGTGPEQWADLAGTVAGAGVAAEAKARRDAAPVRSFIARVLGVHTDERAYRVGAKGESLVAAQLERLGPTWRVIHSVPLSETGTDLDHLVIGPGGVFCLNTKNHPGAKVWVAGDTFMVNGQRKHYVRASRSEGRTVTRLLTAACGFEVVARPVIVLVNSQVPEVKEQPQGLRVCSRRRVADWLGSQPATLSPDEVEAIFSAARRSTTWVGAAARPFAPRQAPEELSGLRPSPSTPAAGHGLDPVPAAGSRVVVTYSPAQGLRLYGDPRPHQRVVKDAGFRWDGRRSYWYVPRGGRLTPGVVESLGYQLRGLGFQVVMEDSACPGACVDQSSGTNHAEVVLDMAQHDREAP